MKKIKYLLLSLFLSLSVALSGCTAFVVIDETGFVHEKEENTDGKDKIEDVGDDSDKEDSEEQSDNSTNQSDGWNQWEEWNQNNQNSENSDQKKSVQYGESYTSKDEVALYLHLYENLPPNYITKKEAGKLGWNSKEGNLGEVAPGKSIGGDTFGNREGILPKGKTYHECDIDSDGGYRNAKRIVYSDDGCIYYTEDHYESFELLYGEE